MLSWCLVILNFVLSYFCISIIPYGISYIFITLFFIVNLFFLVSNLIFFFLMFECAVLPIILILLRWGNYRDRFEATIYFIIYTFLRSSIFFLLIIFLRNTYSTLYNYNLNLKGDLLTFFFLLGFIVKIPVYPFHLWLLKTHLEAPVYGSIYLAGILLKIGVYGLIRCWKFWYFTQTLKNSLLIVSLLGSALVAFFCLSNHDYKLLIANSSVVHIRLCLVSSIQFCLFSIKRSLMIMIRHGLCSSGLFLLCGVIYSKTIRRRFYLSKRFYTRCFSLCVWLFLLTLCNMRTPPSINFFTEVYILILRGVFRIIFLTILFFICFLGGCYIILYYYLIIRGVSNISLSQRSLSISQNLSFFLHKTPLFIYLFWCFNLF